VVYENLWAAPLAAALRRGGAQPVASGRIPTEAILEVLDATERAEGDRNESVATARGATAAMPA
jgi:hypothetical protein